MERSLVLVKPDGVQRGLAGEIIGRFERRGLKLIAMKLMQMDEATAAKHYESLADKPFYPGLIEYIVSGPIIAMVWEGNNAIKAARNIIGATNPIDADPGSIRGGFAMEVGRNLVHGSDSPENGIRETNIFFTEEEVLSWDRVTDAWITE